MMTRRELIDLIALAECGEKGPAEIAMKRLKDEVNPTYHWCHDWDLMVICDSDTEWDGCTCPIKTKTERKE